VNGEQDQAAGDGRGERMILYHYTGYYELQNGGTILKEGLRPGGAVMPPHNVVWLTTRADQAGMWDCDKECRITVVIPSTDRRLVRWQTWARKHAPELIRALVDKGVTTPWRDDWCYFGDVPLERIRAIEHADPVLREKQRSALS
jgi:hypothetical protein